MSTSKSTDKNKKSNSKKDATTKEKSKDELNFLSRFDHNISYQIYNLYDKMVGSHTPLMALEFS
eukprot:Pgem_evm1s2492